MELINWEELFLLELILMRMTGFVLLSPILGRQGIPAITKAGFAIVLAIAVYNVGETPLVTVPSGTFAFMILLFLELMIGFALGFIMRLFFSIVQVGGAIMDTQMGLTMAQMYDASSQANFTITASLLNLLLMLNFFAENGHYTMMRMLVSSGELLPYGGVAFGEAVASYMMELFVEAMLLSMKLALPILAAELLGELGMGILMKAIPQINAFVINIELKVIIGLFLLLAFLTPINEFLLQAEIRMLQAMEQALSVLASP